MSRVLHYRLSGVPGLGLSRVHKQIEKLGRVRDWRSGPPWLASSLSSGLFEMEYFRHLGLAEGKAISAGGFLKMAGDETDALILTIFLRDLSTHPGVVAILRDEGNPLAKLRHLHFRGGRLASGRTLEETLAQRPVIKKVMGQAIFFYPPMYKLHSQAPSRGDQWGYALCGLRAFAPTLLEAEREALKILRGMRHL